MSLDPNLLAPQINDGTGHRFGQTSPAKDGGSFHFVSPRFHGLRAVLRNFSRPRRIPSLQGECLGFRWGPPKTIERRQYVLTAGRSHRDLKTFIEAMQLVTYPGILLHQDQEILVEHGTRVNLEGLPANVK